MTVLALNPTDAPRFEADTEVTPLQGHHLSSAISSFSHFNQQDSGGADSPVQDARAAGFSQRLSISNDGGGGGGGGGRGMIIQRAGGNREGAGPKLKP